MVLNCFGLDRLLGWRESVDSCKVAVFGAEQSVRAIVVTEWWRRYCVIFATCDRGDVCCLKECRMREQIMFCLVIKMRFIAPESGLLSDRVLGPRGVPLIGQCRCR